MVIIIGKLLSFKDMIKGKYKSNLLFVVVYKQTSSGPQTECSS